MKLFRMIVLLAGLGLNPLGAQDPDFHIYLCFGQSNMEGFPGIEEQDKGPVDERFLMLAAVDFPAQGREMGKWYPAVPPLSRPGAGLGPADYFGRTMVEKLPEKIRVGVLNVAVGGCKIELFDEATAGEYAKTAPDWMKGMIAAYGGSPYRRLVAMAKEARKEGVIKGILLHQGESNSGDQEWPSKVKTVYENLLKDLDLRAENVPLLAGGLVSADQNGACAGMNGIISKLPETIPTAHFISSKGCTAKGDHLHFDAAGYRELGRRYAGKMLGLLNEDAGLEEPSLRKAPSPRTPP